MLHLMMTKNFPLLKQFITPKKKYIQTRINEIVNTLSFKANIGSNYLLAAGDGSNWNELESVVRTRYNRPLPDPKAFFKYDLSTIKDKKTKSKKIKVVDAPVLKLQTEKDMITKVHVDVWAYNPQRQTTIVVQKGGNSYVLYGNNNNRYVSADSVFEEGVTYRSLLNELENVLIADLKEKIYGKRGYDYLIALYEKKIVKTRLQIKNTELDLNNVRYQAEGPPKMKKKKKSKKKTKGYSYQDNKTTPQGKMSGTAKKRQIYQFKLVGYNGQLQTELGILKQLKIEKENAFDLLAQYETQLDIMKKNVGFNVMDYEADKFGNFMFSDGTTFNVLNQDITFAANDKNQYFEVILISYGKTALDKKREEIFVHLNLSHIKSKDKYTLYHERSTNKRITPYSTPDSIQIMEFFNALNDTKLPINLTLNSLGVSKGISPYFSSVSNPNILEASDDLKSELRHEVMVQIENKININIWTRSNNIKPVTTPLGYDKFSAKFPNFNVMDFLTYQQSSLFYKAWKLELYTLAKLWIEDPTDQKTILKRIKKIKPKANFLKGQKI